MPFDADKHHRRSIRLKDYDYTDGTYFVTICAHNRDCLFGDVVGETMMLNVYGEIVREEWLKTANVRCEVALDAFVVMPNHVHGIVMIVDDSKSNDGMKKLDGEVSVVGAHSRAPLPKPNSLYRPPRSLGALIAGFKSIVTKRINVLRDTPGAPLWQRNYYEEIVTNEKKLNAVREYILNNPANWALDKENIS